MTGRPLTARVKRECHHRRKHQHGTTLAYRADACRCQDCTEACAAEYRQRSRQMAYGIYRKQRSPICGTRRRLQALAAVGWGVRQIADRTGLSPANLQRLRRGQTTYVSADVYDRVKATYDELWATPPSTETSAPVRVKQYARDHGWAPPLAWDDDSIDDPTAKPHNTATEPLTDIVDDIAIELALTEGRPPRPLTSAEKLVVFRKATERGWPTSRTANAIGVTPRTVDRWESAS